MAEKGGFDYLDSVAKGEGTNKAKMPEGTGNPASNPTEPGKGGGFGYFDAVSKDQSRNTAKLSNLQVDQYGMEESPAEGGGGYVGGNPNASNVGFDYVTGKKGYSQNKPIWSTQSSMMGIQDNAGSSDGDEPGIEGKTESTEEGDRAKRTQDDEGLPQTYRTSEGAGDAGITDSDEPDKNGLFGSRARATSAEKGNYVPDQDIQNHPSPESGDESFSEMPQTDFTGVSEGGAPIFKRSR